MLGLGVTVLVYVTIALYMLLTLHVSCIGTYVSARSRLHAWACSQLLDILSHVDVSRIFAVFLYFHGSMLGHITIDFNCLSPGLFLCNVI